MGVALLAVDVEGGAQAAHLVARAVEGDVQGAGGHGGVLQRDVVVRAPANAGETLVQGDCADLAIGGADGEAGHGFTYLEGVSVRRRA
ncbi:hypothetical protein MVI01_27060 [Myxococcus virescens]|uniref:Uncharacterized protein n=1 Tax=Myxococcus virescens TaxID=83456 RepID=A0A511HBL2_9BACT|nr:hypothetical protein MVI01_27060 [Myxococcus virescens]